MSASIVQISLLKTLLWLDDSDLVCVYFETTCPQLDERSRPLKWRMFTPLAISYQWFTMSICLLKPAWASIFDSRHDLVLCVLHSFPMAAPTHLRFWQPHKKYQTLNKSITTKESPQPVKEDAAEMVMLVVLWEALRSIQNLTSYPGWLCTERTPQGCQFSAYA